MSWVQRQCLTATTDPFDEAEAEAEIQLPPLPDNPEEAVAQQHRRLLVLLRGLIGENGTIDLEAIIRDSGDSGRQNLPGGGSIEWRIERNNLAAPLSAHSPTPTRSSNRPLSSTSLLLQTNPRRPTTANQQLPFIGTVLQGTVYPGAPSPRPRTEC